MPASPPRAVVSAIVVPTEQEKRDGAWAIVKASKDLRATGHDRAVQWARGYLAFDDEPFVPSAPPVDEQADR